MMEVKQNTAVDLNDMLKGSNNSGNDEVDDAVMTDLKDGTHNLVNIDIIKTNDKTANIAELENGGMAMASLINEDEVGTADLNVTVNNELEEALLAGDVLPKITKIVEDEPTEVATIHDDILADKVETSNSTTSSNIVRDPGDDLDTLLSKINDIVEDSIDNESENPVLNSSNAEQVVNAVIETPKETNLNGSLISANESKLNNESDLKDKENLVESSESINNIEYNALESNEGITNKESQVAIDHVTNKQVILKNSEKLKEENCENDFNETVVSLPKIESKVVKVNTQESSAVNSSINNDENDVTKEEEMLEIEQENEITSNINESSEALKTLPSPSNNDANKETCPTQSNCPVINIEQEDISCEEKKTTSITPLSDNSALTDVTKLTENIENDDSDDEIVFYVDKLPETEKLKENETEIIETETETSTAVNEKFTLQKDTSESKRTAEDDDVVLLLDDDEDEDGHVKKKQIKEISSKKEEVSKGEEDINTFKVASKESIKDIDIDNSDNACDDFVAENLNENEELLAKPEIAETPEETNSNCSSSSNLLQEAKSSKTATDEIATEEAENENDEEYEDGEVELVESELKESETSEKIEDSELAPPAKRIRLSEDCDRSSKTEESANESKEEELADTLKTQESLEIQAEKHVSDSNASVLKRSHDVIEIEAEEKLNDFKTSEECANKKLRTEKAETNKLAEIENVNKVSEDIKTGLEDKENIKAVPSYEPILLYPPPKLEVLKSESTISLEFLKKFRKSFDKMTKQDLEELVLQKLVETIIHKSEFSEMRELIEKQEKLITAHRTKILELSKQFRDLEMVHSRVVKDIDQRNSQFIMPVKITRAVGLQVYIPNKKSLTETAAAGIGANVPSSPQRLASAQASSNSNSSLTPPQRLFLTSQIEPQQAQRPGNASSTGPVGSTGNVRRGCVQKITPIRPVPGVNPASSAGPSPVAPSYRNTPSHSTAAQPRILNKNAISTTPNPTAIQRSRYLSSNQDAQRITTQQQISRTSNIPASGQRISVNSAIQSKPSSNVVTTVQRRSEPPSSGATNNSSSIVDHYINSLTHISGGNTAVSITAAKPKEKAVIDLTDEDEITGQTASAQPVSNVPVTQVPRRNVPAQNSSNSQLQYGRAAPSLARIPPANQMANNKNRQISSQGQKSNSFTAISTPPGTSITRINVTPNTTVQRVKYSHPAPLPATPPQAFNPAWKLPPPRPTIRISNLDNGIVISWTMEESMDRHAECVSYQIYAYQETSGPPMVDSWRHVGDVKAMLLPMAVTLTQFQEGQRYYFAVRAVDCHQRYGPFSLPKTWS